MITSWLVFHFVNYSLLLGGVVTKHSAVSIAIVQAVVTESAQRIGVAVGPLRDLLERLRERLLLVGEVLVVGGLVLSQADQQISDVASRHVIGVDHSILRGKEFGDLLGSAIHRQRPGDESLVHLQKERESEKGTRIR